MRLLASRRPATLSSSGESDPWVTLDWPAAHQCLLVGSE